MYSRIARMDEDRSFMDFPAEFSCLGKKRGAS